MRTASAAVIKGNWHSAHKLPKPGTNLRFIYDLLYEHRGRHVPHEEYHAALELIGCNSGTTAQLREFYGCDIIPANRVRGPALIGEYCGKIYLDYTTSAQNAADALGSGFSCSTLQR